MTTEEEGNDFDGEVWAMVYGQDGATTEIKLANPTVRLGCRRRGLTKPYPPLPSCLDPVLEKWGGPSRQRGGCCNINLATTWSRVC